MRSEVAAQELTFEMARGEKKSAASAAELEALIRLHEKRVLGTALRLLGNLDDAQDAAQEVFLRLHKYRSSFDENRDLAPWLYRVTVNVCADMRSQRRELQLEQPVEVPAREDGIEAALDRATRKRLLDEALQRLPKKMRAATVLRDIEGLSTREVAGILGSSEVTVRSQISAARLRLRALVRKKR